MPRNRPISSLLLLLWHLIAKAYQQLKGVSRLIYKESDRAAALKEEFGKMNIKVEMSDDLFIVTGGKVNGARVNSHDDHRIAMAVAVAALGCNRKQYI